MNPDSGTAAIRHRVEIEHPPTALFAALTQGPRLSAWWTEASAEPTEGSVAEFRFGEHATCRMRIDELVEDRRVVWTCVAGPWETMRFRFDLEPSERGTLLRFVNEGWAETDDFYMHCNTKWGVFLALSLKGLLESGTGTPHPHAPSI